MGIIDDIKNLYKKADTALGGYLPGGQSPEEVKQSKTVASTPTVAAPTSSAPTNPSGNFPINNTYDPKTGVYIDQNGQGQSTATPPAGANIIGGSGGKTSGNKSYNVPTSGGSSKNIEPNTAVQAPTAAPTTPAPTAQPTGYFTGGNGTTGTYTAATTKQKLAMTPIGRVTDDFMTGLLGNPGEYLNGGQLEDQSTAATLGYMSSYILTVASLASGAELIKSVVEKGGIPGLKAFIAGEQATALASKEVTTVANSMKSMEVAGKAVLTPDGTKALASTVPEATGLINDFFLPRAGEAVKLATNTKTAGITFKQIGDISKQLTRPVLAVGGIVSLVIGKNQMVKSGEIDIDNQLTSFTDNFYEAQNKLRQVGMNDKADEILQCATDVRDALESGAYDSIWSGKKTGIAAVNKCKEQLSKGLAEYERTVYENAQKAQIEAEAKKAQAEAEARQADIAKEESDRRYKEQQLADQRAYNEAQTKEQRQYNEQMRDEQRRYNEQQQAQAAADAQFAADTATESSGGSTLTFGLLNSSGDIEFVDKDKASLAYFGKVFYELTPAQKRLLMLSKGKIKE